MIGACIRTHIYIGFSRSSAAETKIVPSAISCIKVELAPPLVQYFFNMLHEAVSVCIQYAGLQDSFVVASRTLISNSVYCITAFLTLLTMVVMVLKEKSEKSMFSDSITCKSEPSARQDLDARKGWGGHFSTSVFFSAFQIEWVVIHCNHFVAGISKTQ